MRLVVKSLKQIKYNIDITDHSSVLDLKKLIEVKHGYDYCVLKLIHNGMILEDEKLLTHYSLNNGTPITMMNLKAKNLSFKPNTNEITYNEKDITVLSDLEMKENINCGNLIQSNDDNGDKNNSLDDYEGEEEGEDDSEAEETEKYAIEDIASVIKVLSQCDPLQLKMVLANVAIHKPNLLDIIHEKENEFKVLVSQPITSKDKEVYKNFMKITNGNLYGVSSINEENNLNRIAKNALDKIKNISVNDSLNKQDNEAINRLNSLGFSKEKCLEAYLFCGKNENLAASYLFDNK